MADFYPVIVGLQQGRLDLAPKKTDRVFEFLLGSPRFWKALKFKLPDWRILDEATHKLDLWREE
jgi:hypothetical protein